MTRALVVPVADQNVEYDPTHYRVAVLHGAGYVRERNSLIACRKSAP